MAMTWLSAFNAGRLVAGETADCWEGEFEADWMGRIDAWRVRGQHWGFR